MKEEYCYIGTFMHGCLYAMVGIALKKKMRSVSYAR